MSTRKEGLRPLLDTFHPFPIRYLPSQTKIFSPKINKNCSPLTPILRTTHTHLSHTLDTKKRRRGVSGGRRASCSEMYCTILISHNTPHITPHNTCYIMVTTHTQDHTTIIDLWYLDGHGNAFLFDCNSSLSLSLSTFFV